MSDNLRQLVDIVQERIQAYLDSKRSVGLGVGVSSADAQSVVFGGRVSKDHAAAPDENTLFEVGSITKVFTTCLLADMHIAGEVDLDHPVNQYLPPHGQLVCHGGDYVTLRHLATHTSGLPRLPVNLTWKEIASDNPYANYGVNDLYDGLARCRLKNRPGTRTRYSNLGSGLLGHVLSLVGGADYDHLVINRILEPLGMRNTVVRLSDEQQKHLARGHSGGHAVGNWDFQVLAGAGAFRSCITDMLRFLRANIDPASTPLCKTIELTHEVQTKFRWKWYRDFGCIGPIVLLSLAGLFAWRPFGLPLLLRFTLPIAVPGAMFTLWLFGIIGAIDDMALGWHIDQLDDGSPTKYTLWHNGATAGYASYLAFSRQHRTGVVLLANSDHEPDTIGRALLLELFQLRGQPTNNGVAPE